MHGVFMLSFYVVLPIFHASANLFASASIDANAKVERLMRREVKGTKDAKEISDHYQKKAEEESKPKEKGQLTRREKKREQPDASLEQKAKTEVVLEGETGSHQAGDMARAKTAKDAKKKGASVAETRTKEEEERIAKEVEALHLSDSEIDVDAVAKKHRHHAFQMKVTGPAGKEVCLSETNHGYNVKSIRCKDSYGQQWYWEGKTIRNLNSENRCLGYMIHRNGKKSLTMYDCGTDADEMTYIAWKVDGKGRLRSVEGNECMAFGHTDEHHNALTLPCEEV